MHTQLRLLLAALSASTAYAQCADDPDYATLGPNHESWRCADWQGYSCRDTLGKWGIQTEDDVARLVAACPVSCTDGPCSDAGTTASPYFSYDYNSEADYRYDDAEQLALGAEECACAVEWQGDGECDRLCNTAQCGWDDGDCFHDNSGCYNLPTAGDYRGNVSVTVEGRPCQFWDSQWPNTHSYHTESYPDSNLGGHNHCRNPSPEDGSTGPWCIVDSWEAVWGYCDVGRPSPTPCPAAVPPVVHNHTALEVGEWVQDSVKEHRYNYYAVGLPAGLAGFQVVLVPISGDPNLYLSFDVPFPTGHNYTYKQDDAAVDVFRMTSGTFGYCNTGGYRGGATPQPCTLYVSTMGHEPGEYHLAVLDVGATGGTACAEGCGWKQLGDGVCQPQCDTDACFHDRGDCEQGASADGGADGPRCKVDCKQEWLHDGYCDAACFNAACGWDGGDCGGDGCADDCQPTLLDNGECNAACNVEACGWDGSDCYHSHNECYTRSDGADYRGTVSHTKSGKVCQRWSDQFPNVHTNTHARHPTAGLGGHNYCRNPDGDEAPWCYPIDVGEPRFESCDIGPPSNGCPPPPPSPPPRGAPRPPPPPRRRRRCPQPCKAKAHDGVCDAACNSTACLWDHGDCMSIVDGLLGKARAGGLDISSDSVAELRGILGRGDGTQLWTGALVGTAAAAAVVLGALALYRHRRKHGPRKGMYTFGEAEGPDDPDDVHNGAHGI